jgi:formylglycine-generating enzyme required for sulfatase activity
MPGALRAVRGRLLPPLADLLEQEDRDAERRVIVEIYRILARGDESAYAPLREKVARAAARADPVKGRARAAVALASMGRWQDVWPLLRQDKDPTLQSYLIEQLAPGGVGPRALREALDAQKADATGIRRALILAWGQVPPQRLSEDERNSLAAELLTLYRDDNDPGTHSAAGWVLRRRLGREEDVAATDRALMAAGPKPGRGWLINTQGQTFALLDPAKREAPEGERPEKRFAIGATEVTVRELKAFRPDHQYDDDAAPREDCPVNEVSWYAAAAYCNWLSSKENLQPCYVQTGKDDTGLRLAPDWYARTGYRLPSAREWEYACRAGAVTKWSFGEGVDELLTQYVVCSLNSHAGRAPSSSPVGTLKPNDFGLFDMHGNVAEWCLDAHRELRAAHGGTFESPPGLTQADVNSAGYPDRPTNNTGFRLARTLP